MNAKRTILVVDDDPKILKVISLRLEAAGYNVLNASNGVDALVLVELKNPDMIITDIWMPIGVGFSLAYRLRHSRPEVPIIFLTASKRPDLKAKAMELGAISFLEKPYNPEDLLAAVRNGFEPKNLPTPDPATNPSLARGNGVAKEGLPTTATPTVQPRHL